MKILRECIKVWIITLIIQILEEEEEKEGNKKILRKKHN